MSKEMDHFFLHQEQNSYENSEMDQLVYVERVSDMLLDDATLQPMEEFEMMIIHVKHETESVLGDSKFRSPIKDFTINYQTKLKFFEKNKNQEKVMKKINKIKKSNENQN